jgi:radical SAM-linked protein
MRIRFTFARKMPLAYISHLDMLRLFLRALRRSGLPLAYSQGFNPHPRFTLALPLPLGFTAGEEYGEVFFTDEILPNQFVEELSVQLPETLVITGAFSANMEAPSLASLVSAALYRAVPRSDSGTAFKSENLQAALDRLMAEEEIIIQRKTKKNKITCINVRPYILEVSVNNFEIERRPVIKMLLQAGSQGGVSPAFVIEQLEPEFSVGRLHAYDWQIHRDRLYLKKNGILQPLSEGM